MSEQQSRAPAEYLTMIQEVALILVVGSGETVGYFLPLVARKSWCHSHHLAPPQLEISGAAHTFVYLLSLLKGSELTPCKDATDSSELHEMSPRFPCTHMSKTLQRGIRPQGRQGSLKCLGCLSASH